MPGDKSRFNTAFIKELLNYFTNFEGFSLKSRETSGENSHLGTELIHHFEGEAKDGKRSVGD
ncbi:hypothetical protein [Evansella clarkii]|uniref:hypothetical protein n=1 Tax=Evansella clarkii TaxID=79879 RepID=UPI0014321B32|nr:hypothetical protein [Evansella clarkii]